ncbi:MAG: biopolymer transporter ExbD [Planctomycetaceae bacterium]|nr:biopolymer transporter ExbD [Planctomycetaceae bacterium]
MFGKSKPRVPVDDEDLDITPMIDVTFLLLIFFMVTSNMKNSNVVEIPPAKHGQGISTADSTVITIFKTDSDPEVYLSDGKKEGAPVDMAGVTAYVQQGYESSPPKLNVIIKADRDIPAGYVEEVARACNDAQLTGDDELKFYVGVVDKR